MTKILFLLVILAPAISFAGQLSCEVKNLEVGTASTVNVSIPTGGDPKQMDDVTLAYDDSTDSGYYIDIPADGDLTRVALSRVIAQGEGGGISLTGDVSNYPLTLSDGYYSIVCKN